MRSFVTPNNFQLLGFLTDDQLINTVNWDFSFLAEPVCGDRFCDITVENESNCPIDCFCGNGQCDFGEDAVFCGADCPAVCGNDICEEYEFYPACGDCDSCGDGICQHAWENSFDCPDDCLAITQEGQAVCGNNVCEYPFETHTTCHSDCQVGCGDHVCDNQEWITCPHDCFL